MYLNQDRPNRSWQAVVLWAKPSLDSGVPLAYRTSLAAGQIRIEYLDELVDTPSGSVSLGMPL